MILVILLTKILVLMKKKCFENHMSLMSSMNIRINGDLPTYSIPKPHKHPYKERYTASSSTCSTIEMSITMTSLFTKHQSMWILTNSTDLDNLNFFSSKFHLSKHFDFSTLYTTNPFNINHSHLFFFKWWATLQVYSFRSRTEKHKMCYTEHEAIGMLELLIDKIFVEFGGHIFQQIIGIPM